MANVIVKLNVHQGTMDVECAGEDFERVMTRAEQILEKFSQSPMRAKVETALGTSEREDVSHNPGGEDALSKGSSPQPKAKKKKGGAHSANWKVVDPLLDESQRRALREFYGEKAPGKQNHQVAVLVYKLKELLGRDAFDGHEVHTAFQIVDQKTPANLTGVFGNMTGDGLGKIVDKKWTPNFKSDDLVKHDLPVASKE